MKIEAVLFDLDGTLIDTANDLGDALNHILTRNNKPLLAQSVMRPFVSGGTPALIELGFNITPDMDEFETLKQAFLAFYEINLARQSKAFEGIMSCLDYLESSHLPWGIVTNKPGYLTAPLLSHLNLLSRSKVTISGDTFAEKKPHPLPLLKACEQLEVNPENSLYVGDDERDILAAKAANMRSIAAGWGYPGNQDPRQWNADYFVEKSQQLTQQIHLLKGND